MAKRPTKAERNYREEFRNHLTTLHTIIRASVPLMLAAEARSMELTDDPVCPKLAEYYHTHAKEEAGHDEWLLADLKIIGMPKSEALARRPTQEVAELVGSQYYWIRHWHPVCLLGYIAVMEGNPPPKQAPTPSQPPAA